MKQVPIKHSLNSHQLEILKLFSRELEEKDFVAIKKLIVSYLADKITDQVDRVWKENKWTNDDMERILNEPKRTPYNPKN